MNIKFFMGPPDRIEGEVNKWLGDRRFVKIYHLQQSLVVVPVPIMASPLVAQDAKMAGVELNALALVSLVYEEMS